MGYRLDERRPLTYTEILVVESAPVRSALHGNRPHTHRDIKKTSGDSSMEWIPGEKTRNVDRKKPHPPHKAELFAPLRHVLDVIRIISSRKNGRGSALAIGKTLARVPTSTRSTDGFNTLFWIDRHAWYRSPTGSGGRIQRCTTSSIEWRLWLEVVMDVG